jgi:hypothetical protein
MTTITTAGRTQWDAPITYANRAAYEAAQLGSDLKIKIDGIESELIAEKRNLNLKRLAPYREEILENITKLEAELLILKGKFAAAYDEFHAEGGCY